MITVEKATSSGKYYVYELIDPESGDVFYVGKGKNNRVHVHEKDAFNFAGVNFPKEQTIRDIVSSEYTVGKRIVGLYKDEQQAYEDEMLLINHYGLENLTNIAPGGVPNIDFIESRRKKLNKISDKDAESLVNSINILEYLQKLLNDQPLFADVKPSKLIEISKTILKNHGYITIKI